MRVASHPRPVRRARILTRWLPALMLQLGCAAALAQGLPDRLATSDLADLSLEQLSRIIVTTMSGRTEPLSGALGSIAVISGEDIRRAGATNLTEALRLAPNLQVARTASLGYSITARGFNGMLANKLLVLMDGRSIYTPTFSGVFWEAHDVLLADVERIEVISGPGGVLWGANAVNGVINIITRSAQGTTGTIAGVGAGNQEAGVFARTGGRLDDGSYRVYAKRWRWDDLEGVEGALPRRDGWDRLQAGFRADWSRPDGGLTLQGDVYQMVSHESPNPQGLHGLYLLGRWEHAFGGGDSVRVQTYYDRTSREQQHLDTFDLDAQWALARRGIHRVLLGAGVRYTRDRIDNSAALALIPADKDLPGWNVYALDEITLAPTVDLSVGLKVDHNVYTGAELLPSVRMGWRYAPDQLLWGAVSRAVRAPSRFDRELYLPGTPPYALAGGPDFRSEVARVFELGWRGQLTERASLSATAFFHDLQKIRTLGIGPAGASQVENSREGNTRGIEGWGSLRMTPAWRLQAGFTAIETRLRVRPGRIDLLPEENTASDPRSWWSLRSSHDLPGGWELDVMARHVGALTNRSVPGYTAVDLRVGWRSAEADLSLLLQNLFDPRHIEWGPDAVELRRAAFVKATLSF